MSTRTYAEIWRELPDKLQAATDAIQRLKEDTMRPLPDLLADSLQPCRHCARPTDPARMFPAYDPAIGGPSDDPEQQYCEDCAHALEWSRDPD